MNFLRAIEKRYPHPSQAPYHNSTHATDVLQQMHILLIKGGLAEVSGCRNIEPSVACHVSQTVDGVRGGGGGAAGVKFQILQDGLRRGKGWGCRFIKSSLTRNVALGTANGGGGGSRIDFLRASRTYFLSRAWQW